MTVKPNHHLAEVDASMEWLMTWMLRLPVIRRLGLDRRPREVLRFLKFAAVGAIGMVVDLTVLTVLFRIVIPPLFPGLDSAVHLVMAASVSFTAAVISNFTWNRLWTFPESRQRPIVRQLGQFALVNIVGLGINNVILSIVYHLIRDPLPDEIDYLLAKIFAIGVVLFWNYLANRFWTYRGIE